MTAARAAGTDFVFISHNAADRPFAQAIEGALDELLERTGARIEVTYSTSSDAGPQGGEKWREWIYRQVVEARTSLIVVTPNALGKPWLLWEAGACRGAALAQQAGRGKPKSGGRPAAGWHVGARLIVSIAYGLMENECPDPLRGDQIVLGTNRERARALFLELMEAHQLPSAVLVKAGERMEKVLDGYLARVNKALLQAPSLVTESNVQDWLMRLEELVRGDRLSELDGFVRWLMLAFGREGEAAAVPIDVRLHRRLGELYLARRDFERAAWQLKLARRAAPRDIYVLRPLAEASMKQLLGKQADGGLLDDVESQLSAIKELDQGAFVQSQDAAALRGKYLRLVARKPELAVEVFRDALAANPASHYLADLLAQTQLELGRTEEAKVTWERALEIIDANDENSVWSRATAATACVALGDLDGARARVAGLQAVKISDSEADTIRGALREVAGRVGTPEAAIADLLAEVSRASRQPAS